MRGFNASGVQDIAEAAGVRKGSFYNHFKSKELWLRRSSPNTLGTLSTEAS